MARRSNSPEYQVYSFSIDLTLSRKDGPYNSDSLARVDIKREIPLLNDLQAKAEMRNLVGEELDRILDVTQARIDFDNRVKQLTDGGEIIDSDDFSVKR